MPSGEVHYQYYMRGYWVEAPVSLFLLLIDWQFALGNFFGYSFHRYCDNDLDLMGVNLAEGRQVNELPVLGHILFGLSSIYGSLFRKYHRHWVTHLPGVSTIIRLFVIFLLPFLILDGHGINLIGNGWHKFWFGFWFGLSQADGIHYYLDKAKGE